MKENLWEEDLCHKASFPPTVSEAIEQIVATSTVGASVKACVAMHVTQIFVNTEKTASSRIFPAQNSSRNSDEMLKLLQPFAFSSSQKNLLGMRIVVKV